MWGTEGVGRMEMWLDSWAGLQPWLCALVLEGVRAGAEEERDSGAACRFSGRRHQRGKLWKSLGRG